MLGSGELGKEVVIEFQRYGVEVIAVDRYDHAPAMQVAHRSYTISMLDGKALRALIEKEKPHYIIPEVEAIATDTLVELEREGFRVIPSANATRLTMNREGIRTLAAETLNLQTSPYKFAGTKTEFDAAIKTIGMPCVVKPIMSSSGKGQSVVKSEKDIDYAWQYAQEGGRSGGGGQGHDTEDGAQTGQRGGMQKDHARILGGTCRRGLSAVKPRACLQPPGRGEV